MLDKLKKHSGKFFVFIVNILLMVIAVLVIREKDQGRLLKQAEENANVGSAENIDPASFEGQMNSQGEDAALQPQVDSLGDANAAGAQAKTSDPQKQTSPATNSGTITPGNQSQPSAGINPGTSSIQSNTSPNRTTKTS